MQVKMGAKETGEKWRDNYRTPRFIIDAVKEAFGIRFVTDPFPHDWGTRGGCELYDGFVDRWQGPAFINPPFSRYKEAVKHGITQDGPQIWICHTNNSTGWFKTLMEKADGICLLFDRVRFIDPRTGEPTESTAYGKSQSVILRLGDNYNASIISGFYRAFSPLGKVLYIK